MTGLERICIEHDCATLIAAYCNAVDARDHAAVVGMFTDGGTLRRPLEGALTGHAAIRAFFDGLPTVPRRHVSSNVVVTVIDNDNATAISYLTAYASTHVNDKGIAPLSPTYLIAEYRDRLTRDGGRWKFAERNTVFMFRTDVT
ncbi:MAG: nuclear transport factor 2 family protein [Alcaligenaceae bacterium]|nr:nuclear transport factor 2 family protein [Alcaligenaceae bacterium]